MKVKVKATTIGLLLLLTSCGARDELLSTESEGAASGVDTGPRPEPCLTFMGDGAYAERIEMDATHVYWTTWDGSLWRGELATGASERLSSINGSFTPIALDDTHVYAADADQLFRVAKDSGAIETLAEVGQNPLGIHVAGDAVYLLEHFANPNNGAVLRWTAEAGLQALWIDLEVTDTMAGDASHLYLGTRHTVVDGQELGAPLLRLALDGSSLDALATDAQTFSIAVGEERVFFVGGLLDQRLFSVPKLGGAAEELALIGSGYTRGLAIDEEFAYATLMKLALGGGNHARLLRTPLAGGSVTTLVDEPEERFLDVAVNATHIAYVAENGPDVRVLCKP